MCILPLIFKSNVKYVLNSELRDSVKNPSVLLSSIRFAHAGLHQQLHYASPEASCVSPRGGRVAALHRCRPKPQVSLTFLKC